MRYIEVVKKYIMQSRRNTVLIITSIIISTALFLIMNIISEDAKNLMIDQAKKEFTSKHAQYTNPTDKEIEFLQNNTSIDKVGKSMLLGIHDIGNSQTLQILSQDKNAEEINDIYTLKEGSFPVEENEIAIDEWYIKQKKIENPIGKTIKLDYRRPSSDGKTLYTGEKEFKITGILNNNPILKAQGTSLGVISNESAMNNIPIENKYDQAIFTLKEEKNIQKQIEKIIEDGNFKKEKIIYNNELLKVIGDSIDLKIPYISVNIVLALATILLIYNIFYILISNRTKDFGILRAIGFIPSDVSKIIIIEVFIYSIISIPIGLIIGGLIANLSREYIIGVIYNVEYVNSIKSENNARIYAITTLLSLLTIIISVVKPLIQSSKIDPMVCIRRNEEKVSIKQNKFINKFMNKFFGDYGNIASKNIQRNKKRTNLAIASMVIVFFLVSTVYTMATSNFLSNGVMKYWIQGDYLLHGIDISTVQANNKSYDYNTLKQIKSINGVTKVNSFRHKWFNIKVEEENINKSSDYWKQNEENLELRSELKDGVKLYDNTFEFLGIEDTSILDDVLIDGKENLNKLNDYPYVYITKSASESLNLKKGDKVNVDFNVINPKTNNYIKTITKEFEIGGTITMLPITSQIGAQFGGVISINQFNQFTGVSSYERFDIWTSELANDTQVERELDEITVKLDKGILIPYKSETAEYEKSYNQKALVMALVVGIIVTLSLFNCCNTIVTNINSRSREFALLRGIGISRDEIIKIVKLESLIYILVSFAVSIIPILIVRSIIIHPFENIHLINLKFIVSIVLTVIILIFIIMSVTSKSLSKVDKKDFINEIKTLE
ncbi:ABC transporter permease [[Clostridium] sordellii]|uniref:ABC transporter permease n=1 Tax=Paraclostridium sordellii TaxID=1505 RepID=UPI0005E4423C|nr:ABC transporter permease [Paeniclostridium sordellii]CEN30894.1 ABC transporter permease [[Clostridium] sordellii] [Paeniclostridium sordellii]